MVRAFLRLFKAPTPFLRLYSSSPFARRGPSPPELDPEEQKEFEKLQQASNTQNAIDEYNEQMGFKKKNDAPKIETSDVGTFGTILKTIPEFEGDVNPDTGEVNGPKQDPLKHGHGEWSFNGRTTDF